MLTQALSMQHKQDRSNCHRIIERPRLRQDVARNKRQPGKSAPRRPQHRCWRRPGTRPAPPLCAAALPAPLRPLEALRQASRRRRHPPHRQAPAPHRRPARVGLRPSRSAQAPARLPPCRRRRGAPPPLPGLLHLQARRAARQAARCQRWHLQERRCRGRARRAAPCQRQQRRRQARGRAACPAAAAAEPAAAHPWGAPQGLQHLC